MNILKKSSALLLVFVFVFSVMSINTFAAGGGMKLIISDAVVSGNNEFSVNISLENNPGIAYLGLTLNFDNEYMTPVSFKSETSDLTAISSIQSDGIDLESLSKVVINWDSVHNVSTNGVIGTLTFKAKSNIIGSTVITGEAEIYNQDLADVTTAIFSGEISIVNSPLMGDVNTDGIVTKADAALILKKAIYGNEFKMPIEKLTADYMDYADLDKNGSISVSDAISVLKLIE